MTSPCQPGALDTPVRTASTQWESNGLFAKTSMRVRLLREQGGGGRFAVQFTAAKDFLKPDLIVYWVAGSPGITGTLRHRPVARRLSLGTSLLPEDAPASNGVLVLYSLADGEVVDVSKTFRFIDSRK